MRRSFKEIVELVVFGLIALLLATGLIWLIGWVLGLVGIGLKFVAGIIWSLLRFLVPIAIVAGLAYALVRFFLNRNKNNPMPAPKDDSSTSTITATEPVNEFSSATDNLDSINPKAPRETNVVQKDSTLEPKLENSLDDSNEKKS